MLIFLCPAIMDAIVFLVLFAVTYAAGERHLDNRQYAWIGGIFQLVYMAASVGVGLILSRRNARAILYLSVGLGMVAGAAALLLTAFVPLLLALSAFGVAMALFFNGFQTFMRGEAPPGGLIRATALYTASWSGGASLGFLLSGTLYKGGGVLLALLVLAVSALMGWLLARHRARPGHEPSADEHADASPLHEAYVGVAWVMIFTVVFVQRPLQTFVPAFAGRTGLSAALVSLPLFAHMLLQAAAGGFMLRKAAWLYRTGPLVAVQLLAAGVLLLLWQFPEFGTAAAGIALLGAWSGFAFFCAVLYAAGAGHRSRNVGINECLVGLGSFAGLFVTEWFVTRTGQEPILYAVCAAALVLSTAVQVLLARLGRKRS